MSQEQNLGPGARKIELERRLDANTELMRKATKAPRPAKPRAGSRPVPRG